MRYAALVAASLMLTHPAHAEKTPDIDPRASLGVVQQWIYNYRAKPDYAHVPAAVRVLFHSQSFKEPENAGIYLGFIAGAIGSNPARAEQLVDSLFPIPPEDEWVIVRAIAYSGLPDWRNLLREVAPKMPGRKVMIDSYLAGTLPTLTAIPLEEATPGMLEKLRGVFTKNPFAKEERKLNTSLTFAGSQDLLDTLWGYYFATGSHAPILRIMQMLPWSKSRDTVDKLKGAFTKNPFAKDDKKLNTTLTFASNQDLLDTLWGYYFATGSHAPIQRIHRDAISNVVAGGAPAVLRNGIAAGLFPGRRFPQTAAGR